MKVLILGAGAVGGYFGGKLVEYQQQQQRKLQQQQQNTDGNDNDNDDETIDVTFLVRQKRANQLQQDGMVLDDKHTGVKTIVSNIQCLISSGDVPAKTGTTTKFDVIILTCKSYGLDGALDAIEPYVVQSSSEGEDEDERGVLIIPLLNGMAHLETIETKFHAQTSEASTFVCSGGTCGIVASLDSDTGIITKQTNAAFIKFGLQRHQHQQQLDERQRSRHLRMMDVLAKAWNNTQIIDAHHLRDGKIHDAMWNKWIFLASLGASTCLLQGSTGQIVGNTDYGEDIIIAMIKECETVAIAEVAAAEQEATGGVVDDEDAGSSTKKQEEEASRAVQAVEVGSELSLERIRTNFLHPSSQFKTSMARDMDQGYPTEGDHLVGDLIRRAKRHNISTPLLCAAYARLQIYEAKRQK